MRRVDFTNLTENLGEAKDLIDPELQTNHSAMQELFETIAYNLMSDDEQAVFDRHYYGGAPIDAKSAWFALGEDGGKNHTPEEVLDTLYTGLMNEQQYEDFQADQEKDSKITARDYYNAYIRQYAGPGMNKLASVFEAFLKENPHEKPVKFISREEFQAMNPQDRARNHDRAMKSLKGWK